MIAKPLLNFGTNRKMGLIVPYRNRPDHLKEFIPYIHHFLKDFSYEIFVIEQTSEKAFNRGKLLNIGYLFAKDSCSYLCFHDVDMLPLKADYSYVTGPTHLASHAEQFDFQMPYQRYFGGVTLIDTPSFEKVNGYCNAYWGWGREDDDFLMRCELQHLPIHHREGHFLSLPHERAAGAEKDMNTLENQERFEEYQYGNLELANDGIKTLQFDRIESDQNSNFTHILVNL